MKANFHESQLIDAGNGGFGLKITLPAPCSFDGLDMIVVPSGGFTLNHYKEPKPVGPGDYWLIITNDGFAWALALSERAVGDLGSFGTFKKQDGVAFVTPHNEAWPTSSFGFVYAKK